MALTTKVPGPLHIALMTGRPELAALPDGLTASEVSAAAVALARDVIRERERWSVVLRGVENAVANIEGALRAAERIEEAVRLIRDGAPPEAVDAALRNPNAREGEL